MTDEFRDAVLADPGIRPSVHGSLILIPIHELGRAIRLAHQLSVCIDGIEGFRVSGGALTPLLDYVTDFSEIEGPWKVRVEKSVDAALRIAAAWVGGPEYAELAVSGED